MTNKSCQCPDESTVTEEKEYLYSPEEKSGMSHKPNECKGTNNILPYKRNNKLLYLCSCCNVLGDIEVNE